MPDLNRLDPDELELYIARLPDDEVLVCHPGLEKSLKVMSTKRLALLSEKGWVAWTATPPDPVPDVKEKTRKTPSTPPGEAEGDSNT